MSLIGGLNSIQLVPLIDYGLIRQNPKFFCGYSDITALQNSITTKSGLVTYSGPHFQTLGIKHGNDFTVQCFIEAATHRAGEYLPTSPAWSDDCWYLDQDKREFHDNEGPLVVSEGVGVGHIIGGNLSTLLLLSGTDYMPRYERIILAVEEDEDVDFRMFDRMLESLLLAHGNKIKGILIGRFQKKSDVSQRQLYSLRETRPYLIGIPIIANLNFGHTNPMLTVPIGDIAAIDTAQINKVKVFPNKNNKQS